MEIEIKKVSEKISLGKYIKAEKSLNQILKDTALTKMDRIDALLLLSKIKKLTHRHGDSLDTLNEAIKLIPESKELVKLSALLLKADIFLHLYRYNESLKIIDKAEFFINDIKVKYGEQLTEHIAYLYFVKGVVHRVKGYPNEAKNYLEKALELFNKIDNKQYVARTLRNIGLAYSDNGELDEAINYYKKSFETSMSSKNKADSIHPLAYIGFIYQKKGDLDEAINYHNQRLELSREINHSYGIFSSMCHLGNLYCQKGKLKQAITFYEEANVLSKKEKNQKFLGLGFMGLGLCHKELGDFEVANKNFDIANEIFKKIESQQLMAEILLQKGDILIRKGQIETAIEILRKALMKFDELGNVFAVAQTQQYLGNVYIIQGEIEQALFSFKNAMEHYKQTKSTIPMIQCIHRIGWVHWHAGNSDQAQEFLISSYTQAKEIQSIFTIVSSLLGLIIINTELNDIQTAKKYLEELMEIDRILKNKIVKVQTNLAKAIVYKTSSIERDKGKAEILFENVISEAVLFFPFTLMAILNLGELLLLNIKKSDDKGSLDKYKDLVVKLYILAKEQNLHYMLAESYWMQSQLAIIDGDAKKAQEFIELANNLIEEKKLVGLKNRFSERNSFMRTQMPKISKIKKDKVPLSQLVDHLQLIDDIKQTQKVVIKDLHISESKTAFMKRIFKFKL